MILGKYYKIYSSHGYPMMFPKNSGPPGIRFDKWNERSIPAAERAAGNDKKQATVSVVFLAKNLWKRFRKIIFTFLNP